MIFFLEYQLEIKQNIFCFPKAQSERRKEEDIWFSGAAF